MDLIKIAEQAFAGEVKVLPSFKAGDTITVTYKIKEETKERLQNYRGVVIQRRGSGSTVPVLPKHLQFAKSPMEWA